MKREKASIDLVGLGVWKRGVWDNTRVGCFMRLHARFFPFVTISYYPVQRFPEHPSFTWYRLDPSLLPFSWPYHASMNHQPRAAARSSLDRRDLHSC